MGQDGPLEGKAQRRRDDRRDACTPRPRHACCGGHRSGAGARSPAALRSADQRSAGRVCECARGTSVVSLHSLAARARADTTGARYDRHAPKGVAPLPPCRPAARWCWASRSSPFGRRSLGHPSAWQLPSLRSPTPIPPASPRGAQSTVAEYGPASGIARSSSRVHACEAGSRLEWLDPDF